MKEIIFDEIKDALTRRFEYLGFRMEGTGVAFSKQEYDLLDGIFFKHFYPRASAIMQWTLVYIMGESHIETPCVAVKNITTGEIHEFDLEHLMPELFE